MIANEKKSFDKIFTNAFSNPDRLYNMALECEKFVKDKYSWNKVADSMMHEFKK